MESIIELVGTTDGTLEGFPDGCEDGADDDDGASETDGAFVVADLEASDLLDFAPFFLLISIFSSPVAVYSDCPYPPKCCLIRLYLVL